MDVPGALAEVVISERDEHGRRETSQHTIEAVNDISDYTEELKAVVIGYLKESESD